MNNFEVGDKVLFKYKDVIVNGIVNRFDYSTMYVEFEKAFKIPSYSNTNKIWGFSQEGKGFIFGVNTQVIFHVEDIESKILNSDYLPLLDEVQTHDLF